jgi:hypothetical protein
MPDSNPPLTEEGIAFFETKIWPVLVEHCLDCHGSPSQGPPEAGLSLTSAAGIAAGGSLGPAIDRKDPANSLLMKALRYDGLQMPPDQKLDSQTLADFQKWIDMGAPNPRPEEPGEDPSDRPADAWQSRMEEGRSHWAVAGWMDRIIQAAGGVGSAVGGDASGMASASIIRLAGTAS